MKDPRLVEIEFLSALERERPSSIAPTDWEGRLGVPADALRDMVFDLFRAGCLDAARTPAPSNDACAAAPPAPAGGGDPQKQLSNVLCHPSFAAHINHAGRLRLWRAQDEITRARIKDGFGLLWDHRHWDTDLIVRLAMKDPDQTAVVLFIDVDDLKRVNTRAGYVTGNEVLRIVCRTVLARVTGIGEAYRWGGDEITALLPEATRQVGERLGEVIRAEIEREGAANRTLRGAGLQATVSIGVGAFKGRPSPTAITSAVSDLMLRQVKEAGKNKVVSADLEF